MKNRNSIKLFAFVMIMIMFSGNLNAQNNQVVGGKYSLNCSLPRCGCSYGSAECLMNCYKKCKHLSVNNNGSDSANISFFIAQPEKVSIKVFDFCGKNVITLEDNSFVAGEHTLAWKFEDGKVKAGIYTLKLNAGSISEIQKLIVMD